MDKDEKTKLAEQIKIVKKFKIGANWFFWIAGLSVINTIILLSGGRWNFIFGLGITQIVDSIGIELAKEIGNAGYVIVFVLDIIAIGIFIFFGIFARKKYNWAFIIGMIIYALYGLLFLLVRDFLGIGFHAFLLFFIYGGFKANKMLSEIDEDQLPADSWLHAQQQRELRGRLLRNIKDPCPYCKFNLKSGKDKCDECGKDFFELAPAQD